MEVTEPFYYFGPFWLLLGSFGNCVTITYKLFSCDQKKCFGLPISGRVNTASATETVLNRTSFPVGSDQRLEKLEFTRFLLNFQHYNKVQ